MPTTTITASQVSQPVAVGAGSIVTVTPGSGATATVEYTGGSLADIGNRTAVWKAWTKGAVTSATKDYSVDSVFLRVTAQGGSVSLDVNSAPSATDLAPLTTDWGFGSSQTTSTYLGIVATHCKYPEGKFGAGTNQVSSRINHFATENMRGAVLKYVNYYGTSGSAPGSAATVTASIEYPIGTINRITFGGANSVVIPDGGDVFCDPLPFDIPAGAFFREHVKYANTTGALYFISADKVDYALTSTTTPDNTATGSITGLFGGTFVYGFTLALGQTDKPTVLIIGDSRTSGSGDTTGYGSSETGAPARACGIGGLASLNISCSGASVWQFSVNMPAKVKAWGAYCSHIIIGGGINDINGNNNVAAMKTNIEAVIAAYNPSGVKPVYMLTVEPYTTSTDSWATAANQTVWDVTKEAVRVAHNLNIRKGLIIGSWGTFDTAAKAEDPANPGKWNVPAWTADGLHGNTIAYIAMAQAIPAVFGAKAYPA